MKRLVLVLSGVLWCGIAAGQAVRSAQLMFVGTLDKKLLVIDEEKEAVVGEITLGGIPRTTAVSPDRKKIYIFTTQMLLETVDLETRTVVSSFNLSDPRTRVRIQAAAPDPINIGNNARYSGVAVDPTGRYIYTTMRNTVKDIDQFRI